MLQLKPMERLEEQVCHLNWQILTGRKSTFSKFCSWQRSLTYNFRMTLELGQIPIAMSPNLIYNFWGFRNLLVKYDVGFFPKFLVNKRSYLINSDFGVFSIEPILSIGDIKKVYSEFGIDWRVLPKVILFWRWWNNQRLIHHSWNNF